MISPVASRIPGYARLALAWILVLGTTPAMAQLGQEDPYPGLFSLSDRLPDPPPPDEPPVVLPPLPTAIRKIGEAPAFRPDDPTEVMEAEGLRLEVSSRRDPSGGDFFWIRVRVSAGPGLGLSRVVFHELAQTELHERIQGERLGTPPSRNFEEGLFRATTRIRPVHTRERLYVVVTYQPLAPGTKVGERRTTILQAMIPQPAPHDVPEGRS